MSSLVALMGFLMLAIGLAVLVSPAVLRDLLHGFLEFRWVYWVSGLRVLAGAALVVAAPATKLPDFILLFGVLMLAAGTSIPFLGKARVDGMAEGWLRQSEAMLRAWGALAAVLGAVVAWAGL
ncbi:MAG: hypothetical protein LJE61_09315 [Thiocapsa sp.]|jgi:uncharacterized protein YjeT (DUF2065 family)|nr:hypothetical protein [Thiocapsa sp.]MCG6985380.1 hypothetical protein [Thiocapsa sp.]